MRLWHEALIPYLPRRQLLGLHREVCALRGLGWGKPHSVVNYVFEHPLGWLVMYHDAVIKEMEKRGYKVATEWKQIRYRGKKAPVVIDPGILCDIKLAMDRINKDGGTIYPEHNDNYLRECLDNLAGKGIHIEIK